MAFSNTLGATNDIQKIKQIYLRPCGEYVNETLDSKASPSKHIFP